MKIRKKANSFIKIQILFFIVLCCVYYFGITYFYSYTGYFDNKFELKRLMVSVILLAISFLMFSFVKKDFFRCTYQAMMFFSVVPSAVYYVFNKVSIGIVITQITPLFFIAIASNLIKDKLKLIHKKYEINSSFIAVFIFVTFLLMIPFYIKLPQNLNINNLLFEDIYETRALYRMQSNPYFSYISAPLAKIIFPVFFINFFDKKKYFLAFLQIFNIVTVFLVTGAQKDILVGVFIIFSFYLIGRKVNMQEAFKKFFVLFLFLLISDLIIFIFTGNSLLLTYVRRVFFIIPGLFSKYYSFFTQNGFTYYSQTRLFSIGRERLILTRWAGQVLFGKEINANIGIFVEGYCSFGYLGVVIVSIIFSLICVIIQKENFDTKYLGIWIAMLYVINYTLFETLLLTHGLLIFLLILFLFVPTKNNKGEIP